MLKVSLVALLGLLFLFYSSKSNYNNHLLIYENNSGDKGTTRPRHIDIPPILKGSNKSII